MKTGTRHEIQIEWWKLLGATPKEHEPCKDICTKEARAGAEDLLVVSLGVRKQSSLVCRELSCGVVKESGGERNTKDE